MPLRHERLPDSACPECFAHPWLRDFVETQSKRRGTCPSCRRRYQPLVDVSELYEPFERLLSGFSPAEGPPLEWGTPIAQLIQDEWDVFSERLWDADDAGLLLEAIMDSSYDDDDGVAALGASDPYVSKRWSYDTLVDLWETFSREVKADPARPLAIRGEEFDEFFIHEELPGHRSAELKRGAVLYRARLGFNRTPIGFSPYTGPDIDAPPAAKAGPGRANAKGEVVLYCADQEETALAEVRPARGEYVSVAEVTVVRNVTILDLAREPDWPNPFTDDAWSYRVEFANLLIAFAEQLSKPLRSRDDPSDYIPSQKLADAIKRARVDGIRYSSAMAPGGTNVVLFDPSVVQIGDSRLVEVTDLHVAYRDAGAD